jgi:hypothetical protein
MRKPMLLLAIFALPLALAATAGANTVTTRVFTDNFTVLAGNLVTACGFPIYRTNVGTRKDTSYFDNNGVLVKEVITNFGGPYTLTLTNPANGKSLTAHRSVVVSLTYNPDGTVASQTMSGLVWNFVAPGFGTILQIIGRWGFDATGDEFFVGGQFDLRDQNTGAFCAYMADP